MSGRRPDPGFVMVLASCVAAVAGCRPAGPATYGVQGTVSWEGEPLPRGTVMMVPDDGPAATAEIQGDGGYRLRAVAGRHRVGVLATRVGGPNPHGGESPELIPLLPARFHRFDTSGIVVTVNPVGINTIDLALGRARP